MKYIITLFINELLFEKKIFLLIYFFFFFDPKNTFKLNFQFQFSNKKEQRAKKWWKVLHQLF